MLLHLSAGHTRSSHLLTTSRQRFWRQDMIVRLDVINSLLSRMVTDNKELILFTCNKEIKAINVCNVSKKALLQVLIDNNYSIGKMPDVAKRDPSYGSVGPANPVTRGQVMATMTPFPRVQSAFEPEATHAMAVAFDEFRQALKAGGNARGGPSRSESLGLRGAARATGCSGTRTGVGNEPQS
jgi:hypothetical protein